MVIKYWKQGKLYDNIKIMIKKNYKLIKTEYELLLAIASGKNTIKIAKKLSPKQQKQLLEIMKTFET